MSTRPMHLDGKSVADAIDAAVAARGSALVPVTTSVTLTASDVGTTVVSDDASASTITVPSGLPAGEVRIANIGAGKVTVAAGSGVTLVGTANIVDALAVATLINVGVNTWFLAQGSAT